MKIKVKRLDGLQEINLDELGYEELRNLFTEQTRQLDYVVSELEKAQEAYLDGDDVDMLWRRKARKAKRFIGLNLQIIGRELGKRSKSFRLAKHKSVASAFISIARSRLDNDLFYSILKEAESAYEAEQQELNGSEVAT